MSTQFRALVPSLTRKAGAESCTVKESRRYVNLANAIYTVSQKKGDTIL